APPCLNSRIIPEREHTASGGCDGISGSNRTGGGHFVLLKDDGPGPQSCRTLLHIIHINSVCRCRLYSGLGQLRCAILIPYAILLQRRAVYVGPNSPRKALAR